MSVSLRTTCPQPTMLILSHSSFHATVSRPSAIPASAPLELPYTERPSFFTTSKANPRPSASAKPLSCSPIGPPSTRLASSGKPTRPGSTSPFSRQKLPRRTITRPLVSALRPMSVPIGPPLRRNRSAKMSLSAFGGAVSFVIASLRSALGGVYRSPGRTLTLTRSRLWVRQIWLMRLIVRRCITRTQNGR